MRLSAWLVIAAVLYAGFGLGLLAVPQPFMAVYGVTLGAGGEMMARILGAALIGFALAFVWMRNVDRAAALPLLRASFVYNVLDLPIVMLATLDGVMGPLGWIPVGLHAFLAAGFGAYAFARD